MDEFNPTRLELARKRRGLTKTALAGAIAVSRRMITFYEEGTQPEARTITKMAEVLEFPEAFFHGPDLAELPLDSVSFRALSTLTSRQRDQALGSASLALAFGDWLKDNYHLPNPDVPRLQGVDAETAAEAIRRIWSIGDRPIKNVTHLLEAHGVRVFSLVEECREVDAFSCWRELEPYVFLNTMKSAEHSRMDAAHELGHLVLHWNHGTPRGREAEQEAKLFGSAFLMPRHSVLTYAPRTGRLDQLVRAKDKWRVSVAALVYRMHELGMLTEWQYRSLFIELSERGYRTSEPDGCPRETSQVLAKVLIALRSEGKGLQHVARTLALSADELNKVLFGLVITGVEGGGSGVNSPERGNLRLVHDKAKS